MVQRWEKSTFGQKGERMRVSERVCECACAQAQVAWKADGIRKLKSAQFCLELETALKIKPIHYLRTSIEPWHLN